MAPETLEQAVRTRGIAINVLDTKYGDWLVVARCNDRIVAEGVSYEEARMHVIEAHDSDNSYSAVYLALAKP